jgi:CRISPR/Cas system endoribonuclease Cas6 (RAMP superfamily)
VEDLLQRLSLLSQAYGTGPVHTRDEERALAAAAAEATVDDAALRWEEIPRYSRRQERPMTFGGWTGWIRYRIPGHAGAPYLPLLRAARLLHAGKHTAFGFGAVHLDERDGAPPI